MRAFLTFLLCFLVALHGSANANVLKQPCPMEQGALIAMDMTGAAGDCCNDADTAARTGKLCKTDTPCGSSSACVLPSFHANISFARASDLVPALTALIDSFDAPGVWRPPRS